jgi:hypothetical protein
MSALKDTAAKRGRWSKCIHVLFAYDLLQHFSVALEELLFQTPVKLGLNTTAGVPK